MMRHRKIKAEIAYGLCRAPVVSRIGLAESLGWVRLILDRFRDAAFALTPIHPPLSLTLVWMSLILDPLALSAEVAGAFGADADNRARERLVLAFVFIVSFGFWRALFPLLDLWHLFKI